MSRNILFLEYVGSTRPIRPIRRSGHNIMARLEKPFGRVTNLKNRLDPIDVTYYTSVMSVATGVNVSERGGHRGGHMRSREKGDSLFTMIPLERWNVERRSTFRARVHGELGPADSVRPSIRHEERKLRRRSTDSGTQRRGVVTCWHGHTMGKTRGCPADSRVSTRRQGVQLRVGLLARQETV